MGAGAGLASAAPRDPDLLRALIRANMVIEPLERTLAATDVAGRIMELGRN